jgi:hypothetical protein
MVQFESTKFLKRCAVLAMLGASLSACTPTVSKAPESWGQQGYQAPALSTVNHLGPSAGIF